MLKVFRDNLKYLAWILWLVIAVFVLFVFADFGAWMPNRGGATDEAATVGGETITFGELQRAYRSLEDRFRQVYGEQFNPELAQQLQLPRQALEQLVNRKILLAEARRAGLSVSDEELARQILELFQDADGRFVGDEIYRNSLRRQGYSVQEYEEGLREDMIIGKLTDVLRQNLVIGDREVEEAYRNEVERATIRYLQLDSARFAEEVEASDEEIANYFAEHRESYRLPERRAVSYLLVDANQVRATMEVDEGELFAYYEANPEEFTRQEQVRARHILLSTATRSEEEARREMEAVRQRIEGGEDFAAVAREVSEDPGSKDRGGELGYFGRGQMVPEFEEAAFGVVEEIPAGAAGILVGPITSPFGVHLLEVQDRRPGGVQPFAEVRAQIRARLAGERAPARAEELARELAERAEDGPEGPEGLRQLASAPVAEDASGTLPLQVGEVTFHEPEPFAKTDAVPGMGRDPAFLEAVFALDTGELSDPVQVARGWVLTYLREVQQPRDRELEEVRDEVAAEVVRRKQQQEAVERLAEARDEIDAGATLDDVAASLGLTVAEPPEFAPRGAIQGLGPNPQVAAAAFETEEGAVAGPFETPGGALLFEVAGRTRWDPVAFESERETTRSRLETESLDRMLSALVRERRQEMGVSYTPQLQQQLEAV